MRVTKARAALIAATVVVELISSSFLVSHAALQPQISILLGDPLQPSNILSSPVTLFNHGKLPIYDAITSSKWPKTTADSAATAAAQAANVGGHIQRQPSDLITPST
jgi:hypothetical protein